MFTLAETGRTREYEPPELMRGFLHCYYRDIYGIRPVERELRNTNVWPSCAFDRLLSGDAVDRSLTNFEYVVGDVSDQLVEQAARCGLLDLTDCIDSTDMRAMPADPDASKCYDPTDEGYYYGYGYTIVSTESKIQIAVRELFYDSHHGRQTPSESHSCQTPSECHSHQIPASALVVPIEKGLTTSRPGDAVASRKRTPFYPRYRSIAYV